MTYIQRSQPKNSSMNKVNITFMVLLTIRVRLNYYIVQIRHVMLLDNTVYFFNVFIFNVKQVTIIW